MWANERGATLSGWALASVLGVGCRASSSLPPPPELERVQSEEAAPLAQRSVLSTATHDALHAPERLWNDAGLVFWNRRNLLFLLAATGYSLAVEQFEDEEAEFFQRHTIYSSRMSDALEALGNGLTLYAGALTWYFAAAAGEHEESYEASKTMLSAMTVTAITTLTLKATITDTRPEGGSSDFPSGHSSMSMCVAASLDELYGHLAGFPAYGFATLIGLQRLDVGKHDTGSVVFGWVLGYVTGKTIAGHHAPRIFGLDLGVTVDPETGSPAMTLSRTW